MNRKPRPLAVTVLGYMFIGVGCAGFVYHLREALMGGIFQSDVIWIELTEFLSIVAGVSLLFGKSWARWLATAWMALHVVISALHAFHEFAVHGLLFAGIAWLLFRPDSAHYFRASPREPV